MTAMQADYGGILRRTGQMECPFVLVQAPAGCGDNDI
jgi:hypothetical protein